MSIFVRRIDGGSFEVTSGQIRLQAALEVFGKATVTDIETRETFDVRMVDGDLTVLASPQDAIAATLAHAVIAKASIGPEDVCPVCDGSGGWPGPGGRVLCKPCNGTGKESPNT